MTDFARAWVEHLDGSKTTVPTRKTSDGKWEAYDYAEHARTEGDMLRIEIWRTP